ncbi:MAG: lactonase family protein [Oscillospiraceae bacterium]
MKLNSFALVGAWGYDESADEHGIHLFKLDETSGALEFVSSSLRNVRAGGPCWHPTKDILYVPNESAATGRGARNGSASIYAVSVDPTTGEVSELGHAPALGANPAYVAVDMEGKYLLSANHGSPQAVLRTVKNEDGFFSSEVVPDESNLVLFELNEDGTVGKAADVIKFPAVNGRRSMLHCVLRAPDMDLFAVCDIGAGAVYMVKIDGGKLVIAGQLACHETASARYCAFHPTKKLLLLNNEETDTVSVISYDENGKMVPTGCASAVTADHVGKFQQSDVSVTPDGRYLYSLVRANNTIASFSIGEDGSLTQIEVIPLDGVSPKGCAISPDGRYFYVAAKVSGAILLYSIGNDGRLTFTGNKFEVENPANFMFLKYGSPVR